MSVQRSGPLIGVQRRLAELGRLRYGEQATNKQGKRFPRALTQWRLTSASRELLEEAAAIYGGKVRAWEGAPDEGMWELLSTSSELDVLLPPVLNSEDGAPTYPYSQAYELWDGPTLARRCDGLECAVRKGRGLQVVKCLCDPEARTCSVVTRITVMLPRLPGLGVWRMDSHGWSVATQLPGTLELLATAAAQRRFVPAVLRLEQRSKRSRDEVGKVQTHRFVVPVLDVGVTPEQLARLAGGVDPATWNVVALPPVERPQLTGGPEPEPVATERPVPSWGEEVPPTEGLIHQPATGEQPVAREATAATTQEPAEGDAWMRRVHAAGRDRGLDHEGIRRMAATVFAWASEDEHSLTELTPQQRHELRVAVEELPIQPAAEPPPAAESAKGGEEVPSASPPTDWERAIWTTAKAHGLEGWEAIDAVARAVHPGRPLDELTAEEWGLVGAAIAAGTYDPVPGRPRNG